MFRSDRYLTFVRTFKCVHCGSDSEHAHHFGKRIGGGGTSCKPHDTSENLFTRRALQLVSAWLEKRKP